MTDTKEIKEDIAIMQDLEDESDEIINALVVIENTASYFSEALLAKSEDEFYETVNEKEKIMLEIRIFAVPKVLIW